MPTIQVKNVHKKFKMFYDRGQTFKERLLFRNRNYYEDRWVLQGVDLSVDKGEVVGLIGHNGCGKSTLLKLMTKIMYPDKGDIKMAGRVSSLIELGAGFHPDMRGKENIYTNASIFGLGRKEIDRRLDEIIAFSELEAFINNPVRTYSSGMYMRLAFSVAINVDADILLIDEILAVGDTNFQLKCFEKLKELKEAGTTIVMVTHDMSTVENFCTKAVWLNDGKMASCGDPAQVVTDYMYFMAQKRDIDAAAHTGQLTDNGITGGIAGGLKVPKNSDMPKDSDMSKNSPVPKDSDMPKDSPVSKDSDSGVSGVPDDTPMLPDAPPVTDIQKASIKYNDRRFGLRYIEIIGVEIRDEEERHTYTLRSGTPANIYISYIRHKNLAGYIFGFSINTPDGVMIAGSNTQLDKLTIRQLKQQGYVTLRIRRLPLLPGTYILQVAVVDQEGVPMDYYREYCRFEVVAGDGSVGLVNMERSWEI